MSRGPGFRVAAVGTSEPDPAVVVTEDGRLHLRVTWERIGRDRGVPPMELHGTDVEVEQALVRECGRYLRSRDWGVSCDVPAPGEVGRVSIDGGRFGTGTVEWIDP